MTHLPPSNAAEKDPDRLRTNQQNIRRELNRWRFVVAGLTIIMCILLAIAVVGLYLQAQQGKDDQTTLMTATSVTRTLQPTDTQPAYIQTDVAGLASQLSRVQETLAARETELAVVQAQLRVSEARRLAALAFSRLEYDNELALLLALESMAVQATEEGHQAVTDAANAYPWLANLIGHAGDVTGLAFSPDGHQLASVGSDAQLVLWKLEPPSVADVWQVADKTETRTYVPRCIAFSPDGQLLAIGSSSGVVYLYSVATGQIVEEIKGHQQGVSRLAFSPDGTRLAASSKDGVLMWRLGASGTVSQQPLRLTRSQQSPYSLAFNHTGRLLAVGFETGSVVLWDVEKGQLLHEEALHTGLVHSVAFAPDDAVVLSADEETVVVQSTSNWALNLLGLESKSIRGIALSPDGQLFASLAADRSLRVWRGCARLQHPFRGNCQRVITVAGLAGTHRSAPVVAFHPSGHWLVTSGCIQSQGPLACRQAVVQLWDALPLDTAGMTWREVLAVACARKSRSLTAEERQTFATTGAGESLCPGWQPLVVVAKPTFGTPDPRSAE